MLSSLLPHTHPLRLAYHKMWGIASAVRYGFPSKKMKIIGVTGTDGKTTTVSLIAQLLTLAGKRVGMASTVAFQINEKKWTNESHKTTLGRFGLQKLLRQMADAGCEYAVVEVSSHALMQSRVWGIDFDTVVWTNLSREHLDYHGTMEEYMRAKGKLFENCLKNVKAKKTLGVIYGECPPYTDYYRSFSLDKVIVYGTGDILEKTMPLLEREELLWFSNLSEHESLTFDLFSQGKKYPGEIHLVGSCNVQNALAAIAVVKEEGIALSDIVTFLPQLQSVPGRMEKVQMGQDFTVIIDYAVTPDALKKCYGMLGSLTKGKLLAVLGACGDRDQGKRAEMGEIAATMCDYLILTDEEPYSEDPKEIIAMLEVGVHSAEQKDLSTRHSEQSEESVQDMSLTQATIGSEPKNISYEVLLSRRDAIKKALSQAKTGDTVVITGMGDQTSRIIDGKGTRESWSDREVVREELSKLLKVGG